eukprot:750499-Hanusia_phi.AAC.7
MASPKAALRLSRVAVSTVPYRPIRSDHRVSPARLSDRIGSDVPFRTVTYRTVLCGKRCLPPATVVQVDRRGDWHTAVLPAGRTVPCPGPRLCDGAIAAGLDLSDHPRVSVGPTAEPSLSWNSGRAGSHAAGRLRDSPRVTLACHGELRNESQWRSSSEEYRTVRRVSVARVSNGTTVRKLVTVRKYWGLEPEGGFRSASVGECIMA